MRQCCNAKRGCFQLSRLLTPTYHALHFVRFSGGGWHCLHHETWLTYQLYTFYKLAVLLLFRITSSTQNCFCFLPPFSWTARWTRRAHCCPQSSLWSLPSSSTSLSSSGLTSAHVMREPSVQMMPRGIFGTADRTGSRMSAPLWSNTADVSLSYCCPVCCCIVLYA